MDTNFEEEKIIMKKKYCIPLKDLKDYLDIPKDSDEDSLKKYVSVFDLNPKVNFYVFQKINSYLKYLQKYKYTLFYEDAKTLGCFNEVNENDLIKSINNKLETLHFFGNKLVKITSLSKSKFFNFLLYLLNLNLIQEKFEDIVKKIQSFKLEVSLIYKAPIYLGNNELQYYFFYELFVEFFLYNYEDKKESKKKILLSTEIEYFPVKDNIKIEYSEIDMTDFEKRKKDLLDYLYDTELKQSNLIEINKENDKPKTIELDEKLENKEEEENISNKKKDKEKKIFIKKLQYFKNFEDVIINIFFQDIKDEDIIEKIKFIYFYIMLEINNHKEPNEKLLNSLYIKNNDSDIKKMELYNSKIQILLNGDYNKIVIKNIKLPEIFFENLENPFIDNYLFFTFPELLHKNFIEYDQEIYNDFIEFLKFIYRSPLLNDIYYLCEEFNDFIYPLNDENILNEMIENTHFIPCESKNLYGFTQKNYISIFIPTNINYNEKSHHLEKFIIKLSFILNTCIHEELKHYIKALIFFNSFRYKVKKRIESDENLDNQENKYLSGLMAKKNRQKKISLKGMDGGHRTEILLYGEVLEKLTSLQGLKMFYYSTWKTSIKDHFLKFKDNYKSEIEIKNNSLCDFLRLDEIIKDNEVCPFFRKIMKKLIEFKNIKAKDMYIDVNFSSKKNPEISGEEQGENKEILIDLNYEEFYPRHYYRDYNP